MDNVATLIREGRIEQAEAVLQRASGQETPDYHYGRGLLLHAKGQLEDAIDAFEDALELNADHRDSMFRLACFLDQYGDEERAIDLYEQLSRHKPAHVNALINLATIYEDQNQFELALDCIERVLIEHPNHRRASMFRKDIESSMNMHYDENQERNREKRNAILDTPISDFELSVRSRNCLKKMNINSLGDLLRISEAELLSYKNFGETSLNEIKAMLKQKNLRIGQLKEEQQQQAPRQASVPRKAPGDGQPEIMSKFLSEIELSGRSRKCLQRLNLVTIGDLIIKTEAELLATKNFGQTSLNEIKIKLGEMGLALRRKAE